MVKIDKEKCLGCGACESVCPEGFEMVNGKAKIRDKNADCISETVSSCPVEAIIIDKPKKSKD